VKISAQADSKDPILSRAKALEWAFKNSALVFLTHKMPENLHDRMQKLIDVRELLDNLTQPAQD